MLNRLSVQNKILATLAVPILVIFAASALFVWDAIQGWRTASQMQSVTQFVAGAEDILDVVQEERYWALEYVRGSDGAQEKWAETVEKRNKALDALGAQFKTISEEGRYSLVPEEILTSMNNVQANLRPLVALAHTEAERNASQISIIARDYTDATALLLSFIDTLGNSADNRALGDATLGWEAVSRYKDEIMEEKSLVSAAIAEGRKATGGSRTLAVDVATDLRQTTNVRAEAQNIVRRAYRDNEWTLPAQNTQYGSIRHLASQTNAGAVSYDVSALWPEHVDTAVSELEPIRDDLLNRMQTAAANQVNSERTTVALTILAVVVTLLVSLGLAYLISRSITRPIRNLSQAAENVKNELPRLVEQVAVPGSTPDFDIAPIEIQSRDEVGQLAASFNSVNQTTVEIAREQAALRASIAEMFVNVARRDHVLLNRQLGFLDELERQEEDPNILANLFRLDHLATRMRRNSESLLVLAGIDSGRRVRMPMAMSDVIRTASSEIEQYDRIQLNLQADPMMLGHNALNAAHLIAELLENATNFSEPNTPVEVTTSQSKHFMTVIIRDYGLGMSEADIAEANKKVASRSASDVVGVQRVGLFVVGRLADRLGVHLVFSRPTDGTSGTVISLSFPFTLFESTANQPLPQPTDPLSAATQQATEQWVSPEPEVAVPVDLGALTDGTTNTGMPKRRVSGAAAPVEAFTPQLAQSEHTSSGLPSRSGVGISPDVQEADIVLPPLATPLAPVQQESSSWQPDSAPAAAGTGLPTRKSSDRPNVVGFADDQEVTPKAPEQRSAMFSSFRSFNPNAVRPDFEEVVDPESPLAEPALKTATSSQEQLYVPNLALENDLPYAPFSPDVAGGTDVSSISGAAHDVFVPEFADEQTVGANGDAPFTPTFANEAAQTDAEDGALAEPALSDQWNEFAPQDSEYAAPQDASPYSPDDAFAQSPQGAVSNASAASTHSAPEAEGSTHSYFAQEQYEVAGPGVVTESEMAPPSQPTRQVRTAFSALSPASGAEWAERFASLPTRASLAREARMAGLGSAVEPMGQTEHADQPVGDAGEWQPVEDFAPQESNEPSAQDETAAPHSEMWIPTFADEDASESDASTFDPVARVDSPAESHYVPQFEDSHLEQPAANAPAFETLGFETPALEGQTFDGAEFNEPAFEAQTADAANQLNPGHPFSPVSAPSAISPLDHNAAPAMGLPTAGMPVPTGAVAPVGAFADVVSDLPTTPAKKEKQSFFGGLFKKKEKAPKAPKKAKGDTQTAPQSDVAHPFTPLNGSSAPQGLNATSFAPAANGQPAFTPPTVTQPSQGFTPLVEPAQQFGAGTGAHNPSASSPAPAQQFGGAQFGATSHAPSQPETAVGLPARGAQQPAFSSESNDAPFVPTFQAGAPLGTPAQDDEPFVPAFQQGAPLGTPAQEAPAGSWSPADQQQAFGAGSTPHWEPPALFGQESGMALQSTIQEQAFAELSELSAYRPNQVSTGNTNLTRRVRTQMDRPAEDPSAQKISRDAAELRSRLSAFQSATARGRQEGVSAQSVQGAEGNEVPTRVPDSVND